ncbi:hypothetical protein M409DRAFT_60153 [Zasmidium cellare ATCC 36951]|uniref:FAD/NAD(P)-binding domain-containing protein n=1 Tax=Zasmidium cellare ATCC 36951 TaxID=1080233 RepID=A0A6A6C247_ZASCE|nr:uncharacterized protein M409DRAFT_60153 [Zasmidium cellare ATCC 36951]KAF2160240.1 hypothetical protein M409DRAFT_60153 [Zasmidium cellare ATCC 36951]
MSPALRNVVVVGGSYVGLGTARELMKIVPASHRVLLVEPHSHFNHIFTFPRFAILPGHEQKAFVPYTAVFNSSTRHALITARATSVHKDHISISAPFEGTQNLSYDYLVIATGTLLAAPSMMPFDTKTPSVKYIQNYQRQIEAAETLTIVGGGAVGVQMALDVRELYPNKEVVLVQSREKLMPVYHEGLDRLLRETFEKQNIRVVSGARAVVPEGGFPKEASSEGFTLHLNNGDSLKTNFVVPATGQKPNNQLIQTLPATDSAKGLINQKNGFLRVRKTLQLDDPAYTNIFAVGDIADSGAHKAARPGSMQAGVVARNLVEMIEGKEAKEEYTPGPAGIHLSLGLKRNIIFRNPNVAEGETEPTVTEKFDGQDDLSAGNMWTRLNVSMAEERAAI